MRKMIGRTWGVAIGLSFLGALILAGPLATAHADPPTGQSYTGVKRCASCHFDQFMKWKKSGHAKAFEILTAKYQKDEKCLECHTTGFGITTGFKDNDSTPALANVTCEVCHGPGSEHEKISTPFAKVKKLTPEQEKAVRGSIWKVLPKNVCIECHKVQGHKDSATPKELQTKK
jgi:hypothetical protein